MTLGVVILAAGRGTRMQSNKQKILHEVGGRPMVLHVFLAATAAADLPPVVVVAPGKPGVAELLGGGAVYIVQSEPLGTGHATQTALPFLQGRCDQVLVVNADMPLLRRETMELLARRQRESGAAVVVLSVMGDPGSAFGRIVRDSDGRFTAIVEAAEARRRPDAAELLTVREQNVGVYCFDARWLWDHIERLPLRQGRQRAEYYLTDLVEIAAREGKTVEAIVVDDPDEGLGAGTRAELVQVEKAFRRRATNHWLANGVSFIDPDAVYIDPDVTIGQDCVIWPNTYLQGATVIGEGCVIGPNAVLRDALVGRNCRIEQAVVENSTIPDGKRVEPFSLLRGRQDAEGV